MNLILRKYSAILLFLFIFLIYPASGKASLNLRDSQLRNFASQIEQYTRDNTVVLGQLPLLRKFPVFKNIQITTPRISMAKSGGKEILFVSGTADIFGKELAVICGVTKNGEENGPPLTVFLGGVFPNQWSLVQAAPAFKRIPVFKDIEFTKVGIIFSNAEVELESKIFPQAVRKFFENALGGNFDSLEAGEGLNFFGGLSFERIPLLKKAKQIFGLQPSLLVQGLVAKNIRESYITVNLPSFTTPSFFPKWFKGVKPTFTLNGEPSVEVEVPVTIILPPKKDKVTFLVKTKITSGKGGTLAVVGKMDGTWNNALGIRGFALEDLTIEGNTRLANPSLNIGLGGTFHIGEKEVSLAAILPATPNITTLAFRGKVNSIGIYDYLLCANKLIETAAKLANRKPIQIPLEKLSIPNIRMENVDINIAPAGGSSELGIEDGLGFKGQLYINKRKLSETSLRVSDGGVFIKQNIARIKLGSLSLTSADGEKGPFLDMALTSDLKKNHFNLSGKANLLGLSRTLEIQISRDGYYFAFTDKVFDLFKAHVQALMKMDLKNPDFFVYGEFEGNLREKLNGFIRGDLKNRLGRIKEKLGPAKEEADRRLKDAEDKVRRTRDKVRGLDRKIRHEEKRMERKLRGPNRKLDSALRKVRDRKGRERSAYRKYKNARRVKKAFYRAKYTAAKTSRKAAEKVLHAAKRVVNRIAKKFHPKIIALKTARAAANGALTVAEKFLQGIRKSNDHLLSAVNKINLLKPADILTNPALFNIDKVSFEGDLGELKHIKSPRLDIKYTFMGKEHGLKLQVDLSKPASVAREMGKKILKNVQAKLMKNVKGRLLGL